MKSFWSGVFTAIIVILVIAIVIPNIIGYNTHQCRKCMNALMDARAISAALEMFKLVNGIFPESLDELEKSASHQYLKEVPKDPWGNRYMYATYKLNDNSCYVLWSFGSDGVPDGVANHERDVIKFSESDKCVYPF